MDGPDLNFIKIEVGSSFISSSSDVTILPSLAVSFMKMNSFVNSIEVMAPG